MTDRLRAGVIGGGFMGGVHAHAIRAAGGTVAWVASSTEQSAADAAQRIGAERSARSTAELIEADDVDVVHICTPNSLHAPLAEAALRAGKHVVCEKPLATTVEDARRLAAAADEADRVAAVPFIYRMYPVVREVRERIAAGGPDRLHLLHGSYLQDWLADPEETNWRVDAEFGGASRAFGDIGVHWCDLMEFTTGHRITRLLAHTSTVLPHRAEQPVTTEDAATVVFETDRGATGSVQLSQVSHGRKNRLAFSFDGADAAYMFDQEHPDVLTIGGRTHNSVVLRAAETLHPRAARYSVLPPGHPQGYQDCFNAFVADVFSAINGQIPDGLATFTDGLRAATITAAVVESAQLRGWVEVPA